MLNYRFQSKKRKLLRSRQEKWNLGLNKLVSKTQIKPNELASMTDCQLVEDGKIQCPRDGQDYYGSSQGSRITGIHPYYLSDGTKQLLIMSGTSLYKYNSGSWSAISGKTRRPMGLTLHRSTERCQRIFYRQNRTLLM